MPREPHLDILCRVDGRLLEGPAWVPHSNSVRFVDIDCAELLSVDLTDGRLERRALTQTCSAWIRRRSGGSVVACRDFLLFLDAEGREEKRLPLEADVPTNRANDAKCDPAGRLWVGTMSLDGDQPSGALYRVDQGVVSRVLDGVTVSNGLGWSPDGTHMYFVDSPTRRVDVLDYHLPTGTVSRRRCLVDTERFAGSPDGMAIDANGCLWIAFWDGGAVHQFSPDGDHLSSIAVGATRPTSCAFVGPELGTLAITSAKAPDGTGGDVYAYTPGVTGQVVADYDG